MLYAAAREAGDKLGVEPGVSKLDSDSAADLEPFFADERAKGHLDEDAKGPEQPKAKPRSLAGPARCRAQYVVTVTSSEMSVVLLGSMTSSRKSVSESRLACAEDADSDCATVRSRAAAHPPQGGRAARAARA